MKLKLVFVVILLLSATGCSGSNSSELGTDLSLACTLLTNPDEYRVGVLMIVGAAKNNPGLEESGKGDPYNYINNVVRDFSYPGEPKSLDAQDIKNQFATALDTYAASLIIDVDEIRYQASANLDEVALELRNRCVKLGFKYTEIWPKK
jgi:hypothetical protein